MSEWDRIIPQSNITLDLLQSSRANRKLSAYACIHGALNFQATPMALLGTRVIVHTNPDNKSFWDINGQHGWYIGLDLDH